MHEAGCSSSSQGAASRFVVVPVLSVCERPVLMLMWLRRSRLLRLVLVAFMVPLLVITSGSGASAASASQTVRFEHSYLDGPGKGNFLVSDVNCTLALAFLSGSATVSGECRGGPDLTPFMTTPGEPGSMARFYFTGSGTASGNNAMVILSAHDKDGVGGVAGTIDSTSITFGGGFTPSQLCMVLGPGDDDKLSSTQCQPVAFDSTFGECQYGKFGIVPVGDPYWISTGTGGYSARQLQRDINVAYDEVDPSTGWRSYVLLEDENGYTYRTNLNSAWNRMRTPPDALRMYHSSTKGDPGTFGPGQGVLSFRAAVSEEWAYNGTPKLQTRKILGIGIFRQTGPNGYSHHGTPSSPTYPLGLERMGVNDPSLCSFYWGDPMWTDGVEGQGADEPMGALPDAPDDEQPLPEPEDDVPAPEDMDRGLWGLLKQLLRALGAIASAISGLVQQLLDGLMSLFIPSEGFLDDAVQELRDQADDSNIGEWNDAFSGLFSVGASGKAGAPAVGGESLTGRASATAQTAPSGLDFGGGGCQGPSVDISVITPDGMGSEMDTIHPFAACEGITSEMAGWSRLLSSLFLALFGGFKMFGYVASASFGMKQTEIMRDHDWQSGRLDGRSM